MAPVSALDLELETASLADLRLGLAVAVEEEDYAAAARLRDVLQLRETDCRVAVEAANQRFYDAFTSGSLSQMAAAWGQGDHIQVVHPGFSCIAGREAVMDSWAAVLANVRPRAFKLLLEDVRVFASEGHGFVTCVEVVDVDDSLGRIMATNIFEKQDGEWVMVMHHGSAAPAMLRRRR